MSNKQNEDPVKQEFRENLTKALIILGILVFTGIICVTVAYSNESVEGDFVEVTVNLETKESTETTTITESSTEETTETTTEVTTNVQPAAKPQVAHDYVASPGAISWNGQVLTRSAGTIQGPSGKETYYNLPMNGVIRNMRNRGFSEAEYPYWIREDGCKMLGDYIMVAASLDIRPYGTIVQTSRGLGIVADTGSFASSNQYQLDLAVSW
ncbi:MAG: hypothetical protein IKG42_00900 [Clostridia bacterium]|nr:hypothetical protein [Clostridia bacterium]